MKLYLSSYGVGNHPKLLADLVGSNKRTAIIMNAQDYKPAEVREERYNREYKLLLGIGLEPEELDLRNYFGDGKSLRADLGQYGLLWIRGGNVFVLRKAMRYSGFDTFINELLADESIVYGGFSAGSCVAGYTLRGIELVDDCNITPDGYNDEIIWDGLNLINYSIAPHYRSGHYESEAIEETVSYFKSHGMLYKRLRDGEVIVVNGNSEELIK